MNRKQIAEERLDSIVKRGQETTEAVILKVTDEVDRRRDYQVPNGRFAFGKFMKEEKPLISMSFDTVNAWMHDNALSQSLGKLDIPNAFHKRLFNESPELAVQLMNDLRFRVQNGLFVRTIEDRDVMAVLSQRYKPLDFTEVAPKFLDSVKETGMIMSEALVTNDLRYSLRAIFPKVIAADDPYVFGASLTSSDYGRSAMSVNLFMCRLVCVNGMIGERLLRQVHSGSAMNVSEGDSIVTLSDETLRLSAETTVSYMQDALRSINIEKIAEQLANARIETVDVAGNIASLRKRGVITKEEGERVVALIEVAGEEVLPITPEKNSRARFANALSWMAQQKDISTAKRVDLEEAAGAFLRIAA